MGTPNIPRTQQDALPILTISQATGGDVQVLANSITRFWAQTVLAMTFSNVSTGSVALSPILDVRGCSRFSIVITRSYTVDRADNIDFGMMYGTSGGTFPQTLDLFNGRQNMSQVIGRFNIGLGQPTPLVFFFPWSDSNSVVVGTGSSAQPDTATLGTAIKFFVINNNPVVGTQTWTFEMWGAGPS